MVVGMDVTHPSPGSASNASGVLAWLPALTDGLDNGRRIFAFRSLVERWWLSSSPCSYPVFIFERCRENGKHSPTSSSSTAMASPNDSTQRFLRASFRCYARLAPSHTHLRTKKGLPHITIMIVGKRHHTCIYPTATSDADRSSNPTKGTVATVNARRPATGTSSCSRTPRSMAPPALASIFTRCPSSRFCTFQGAENE
ncbi:hypothetical protein MMC16_006630 [Acarospora aff. strigata]|nr:hypothetical protein [Acarospora aff. strigata]